MLAVLCGGWLQPVPASPPYQIHSAYAQQGQNQGDRLKLHGILSAHYLLTLIQMNVLQVVASINIILHLSPNINSFNHPYINIKQLKSNSPRFYSSPWAIYHVQIERQVFLFFCIYKLFRKHQSLFIFSLILMTSKQDRRQQSPNSYKYIHLKNINMGIKQSSESTRDKNNEYFPKRSIKRESSNHQLETTKTNTTNQQYSQSSRNSKRQTYSHANCQQDHRALLRENEKLRKELTKCQKLILEKDDQISNAKQFELELVQTYRVIHYYEGKMKELEKICSHYEREFEGTQVRKSKMSKASGALEELRNNNSELNAQLEQKNQEINKIKDQLRKVESRYRSNQHKVLELNKKVSDNRLLTERHKFVDDYEQNNLCPSTPKETFMKRRPELSKGKRLLKNSSRGESDSEGSGASSEYKNSVYIKRKSHYKSRQDSLRSSKHKSITYGNISSKLNNIQSQMQALRKQNQRLHEELDAKTQQILKISDQNQELKLRRTFPQEASRTEQPQIELTKVTIAKQKLKQIENPTKLHSINSAHKKQENKLSMFVSNISGHNQANQQVPQLQKKDNASQVKSQKSKQNKKSGYCFSEIKERTLRKLVINIARQDITYFNLIDNIVEAWTSQNSNSMKELLEDSPYNLTSSEISQFVLEYKLIGKHISSKQGQSAHKDMNEAQYKKYMCEEVKSILKDNLTYFKNITIRRDFTLNIQLSNKFKNYEKQLEDIMQRYGNKLPVGDWEAVLVKKWGLTAEECLFLQLKNFQEYDDIDFIHITELGKYFLLE